MEEESLTYGRHPVMECLRSGRPVNRLYVLAGGKGIPRDLFTIARERGIPVVRCDRHRMDKMLPGRNHQGIAAQVGSRAFVEVQEIVENVIAAGEPAFILALDGVNDPGNFGALLRSAEAAGAHGVIIRARGSCGLTPAVSRAAAGADEHLRVARVDRLDKTLQDLRAGGLLVVAADPEGAVPYTQPDFTRGCVLVLGEEGSGVSGPVLEAAELRVRLPLRGSVQSLNMSACGAVLLYEVLRQRGIC